MSLHTFTVLHSLKECTVLPQQPQGRYKKPGDEIEKGCKVIKDTQQQRQTSAFQSEKEMDEKVI